LTEVEIVPTSRQSIYDSEWITADFYSSDTSWFADYYSGRPRGAAPIREILLDGRALILGTELKERAYRTVAANWLASLALLELSRTAVELGSQLEIIVPILTIGNGKLSLRLMLDFSDANHPDFLEKLKNYSGPKNTNDLTGLSDLVVHDLRQFSAEIDF